MRGDPRFLQFKIVAILLPRFRTVRRYHMDAPKTQICTTLHYSMDLWLGYLEELKEEFTNDVGGASLVYSSLVFGKALSIVETESKGHSLILFATLFSACYEKSGLIYAEYLGFKSHFKRTILLPHPVSASTGSSLLLISG
ncbi:hypothetical protein Y032_0018g3629 [Ancylostoma ceylanicum]|uniref:Uncharacterized protein n=1 Tax=Ancylostoma ceylanicum TaxID=53326 RepID=A0A016V3Y3_9BILA|nr:hypothetical protein Y032_0018g3629 [Ancylostoma ceylanicum]